jgi:hypothetical protein
VSAVAGEPPVVALGDRLGVDRRLERLPHEQRAGEEDDRERHARDRAEAARAHEVRGHAEPGERDVGERDQDVRPAVAGERGERADEVRQRVRRRADGGVVVGALEVAQLVAPDEREAGVEADVAGAVEPPQDEREGGDGERRGDGPARVAGGRRTQARQNKRG